MTIIDYALCLVDCLGVFLFFRIIYEHLRFSKWITYILLIIESLLTYFINVYCARNFDLEYTLSNFILLILFTIIQFLLIKTSKKSFIKIFVFCIFLISINGLIATVIILGIFPLRLNNFITLASLFIYRLINLFVFYKLALYIQQRKQYLSEDLINKYLLYLTCPTLLQYCINDFYFKYRTTDYLILLAFSVFVTITLMITLYRQLKNEQEKAQNIIFSNLLKSSQTQMNQILENEEKLKEIRHDLKNHLIVINSLIQENKQEETIQYINEIDSSFKSFQPKIYCNNIYLNSILNNKTSENKDINFKIKIHNSFCGHFDDMDLCI